MLNIIHKTLVGGLLLLFSFFSQANDASPLRVGIDLTYAPYAYLDNKEASGFDPDLMRLLGKNLNRPVEFKDTRIENIIIGLNAGHYDLVASALMLILNVRSKLIFSLIYKLEAFLLSEVTIAFLHKN